MSRYFFGLLMFAALAIPTAARAAEEIDEFEVDTASPVNPDRPQPRDESWYYHPTTESTEYKPNPTQIMQQRAYARGQQRDSRLASCNWYGVQNGRPTAAATPFTSPLYSAQWQSPYRNGLSWRPSAPVYIVTGRPTYTVR
jgi:hypothetical protein